MTRHTPLIWATLALFSGCPAPETAPTLEGATLTPADAVVSSILTCTPEMNSPDTDAGAMSLAYTWIVGSTTVSGATTDTLDGQFFIAGDEVTCRITPNGGDPVESNTVTVGNTAPVIESVTIAPTTAYTNTLLIANVNTRDDDILYTMTYSYTWFSGTTAQSVTGHKLNGATSFNKGERITVQVVANDGTDDSAAVTSNSVLILNTPPGPPKISISPHAGILDLLCKVETPSKDDDNDAITYNMEWTVNSMPYTGTPSTTHYTDDTIAGTETAEGDVWECTATPNDGEEDGATARASVTISTRCVDLDCAVKLTGEITNDRAGSSVASAGDVNGDGYDDILVGAPNNTPRLADKDHGSAYLVLGSSTGISDMSLASADAKLTGEPLHGQAGTSVSTAGDTNGDGYDDILIGAPGVAAYLVLGSSTGISDMSLSSADAILTGGYTLVSDAGDVNNDGYDDILIETDGVYLVLGSSTGISDMNLSSADATLAGEHADDWAGSSFSAAGDANGDGYDDVLVGAPYEKTGGLDAGAAYLVLSSSSGISDMSLSGADAKLTGEFAGDHAGDSVASAGDVNNDGYADILVGAWAADTGGTRAGAAYLVLGSSSGISDMNLSSAYAKLTGEYTADYAGDSVASAGDVNNDGYSDILVGARGSWSFKGTAYLVLGSSSGISHMSLASADARFMTEMSGSIQIGGALGAGDVNNDGYSDLLLGAQGDGTVDYLAGAAYLLWGGPSW